jgi:hypothetical protein
MVNGNHEKIGVMKIQAEDEGVGAILLLHVC